MDKFDENSLLRTPLRRSSSYSDNINNFPIYIFANIMVSWLSGIFDKM